MKAELGKPTEAPLPLEHPPPPAMFPGCATAGGFSPGQDDRCLISAPAPRWDEPEAQTET